MIQDSTQSQLQPGVVVVTAPLGQYGYRTMGYPSPMQPPSYMPQPYTAQHTAEVTKTDTGTVDGEEDTHF